MSRRDTILVAAFLNAGLLAMLFMIAIHPDQDQQFIAQEHVQVQEVNQSDEVEIEIPVTVAMTKSAVVDEVDRAIEKFIEVKVKRGDVLEKLARANGTSVSELKEINNLSSERIEVGQVLRVPANQAQAAESLANVQNTLAVEEEDFYTIKQGDHPWKIAKQFNVRFDKLLEMNDLNEEKARKLRAGDRIRVH